MAAQSVITIIIMLFLQLSPAFPVVPTRSGGAGRGGEFCPFFPHGEDSIESIPAFARRKAHQIAAAWTFGV